MELNSLKPKHGSRHKKTIKGRGVASGKGRSAGKGMKGQNVRKSGGTRLGFEGGQNPLFRRIPKIGFKNINKIHFNEINVVWLNKIESADINAKVLLENRIIKNTKLPIKIIGNGKIVKAYNVTVNKITAGAKASIEAAGGSVKVI